MLQGQIEKRLLPPAGLQGLKRRYGNARCLRGQRCNWFTRPAGERFNNLSTIFSSNTPVSWILSSIRVSMGSEVTKETQVSLALRVHQWVAIMTFTQIWFSRLFDWEGGGWMLLMLVQHLSLIIADNWPARTSRATWASGTNGKWLMDSPRNHKTHWLWVVTGSLKLSFRKQQYSVSALIG